MNLTSFATTALFLASLVSAAIAAPSSRTQQRSLRTPSRELPPQKRELHNAVVERKLPIQEPTSDDLCDQATVIKNQLADTNAELAEVNAQITLTEEKLSGLEDELSDAQDERDMKDKYIKHLEAYPAYAAGIEALEETEAALQAALAVLTSSAATVAASSATLDASTTYEKLFSLDGSPLNILQGVQQDGDTWAFGSRKMSIQSSLLATCAALENGGEDCDAAATNLDVSAMALQDASDAILDIAINNDGRKVRLLHQSNKEIISKNFKSSISTRRNLKGEEDELEDMLREVARLTNVASNDVQTAFDQLGECTPTAATNLLTLKALESALNAAEEGTAGDAVLTATMNAIQDVLAEIKAMYDDPKNQLDIADASITVAQTEVTAALTLAAQCLQEAEAECEEYVAFLRQSLVDTLALAENLESLQDQLYADMLSQHEDLGQMFSDQTEMVAEAKELAECADELTANIQQTQADTAGRRNLAAPMSTMGREL